MWYQYTITPLEGAPTGGLMKGADKAAIIEALESQVWCSKAIPWR